MLGEPAILDESTAPEPLIRVGPSEDPLAWPNWKYAGSGLDRTFGNRWDDPDGNYRVLYTSAVRLGCFLEVLASFRPDRLVEEAEAEVVVDDSELPITRLPGHLAPEWLEARRIARLRVDSGSFARVSTANSLAFLDQHLAPLLVEYGFDQLDAALIRLKAPRQFTQRISKFVFEASRQGGTPFAGIRYASRHGDDIDNYAIFEGRDRSAFTMLDQQAISWTDPDLRKAAQMHGITLDDA